MTLPPLTAGNTYFFLIVTQGDGVANMQTSPYRSQLPTGSATVMSGPITVNSAAATRRSTEKFARYGSISVMGMFR